MSASTQDLQKFEVRLTEGKHQIAAKASQDAAFHDALLRDPKESIEKLFDLPGGTLANVTVEIFEEKPGTIGIVIPARPLDAGAELSEEQLISVAAGAAFAFNMQGNGVSFTGAAATSSGTGW